MVDIVPSLVGFKKKSRWGRDFQTGTGAHPASCKMGTGSFTGVNCGRGVLLTTHPLLVPRSWKSRAIPLPTLWATPGQQRDHFTLFTAYADLPMDLRIPHYVPDQFCYTIWSHVQARSLITVMARSLVTLVQIAAMYEHYVELGVATSWQRVALRLARCEESIVLWNVTKGTVLGHILEEIT